MAVNEVKGVKLFIEPFDLTKTIYDIYVDDTVDESIKERLKAIDNIHDLEKWKDGSLFEKKDSLPLYLTGFKPVEISVLKKVSRQAEHRRLQAEIDKSVLEGLVENSEELFLDHQASRAELQQIVCDYYVQKITLDRDLSYITKLISDKKYKTKTLKFKVYKKLGGLLQKEDLIPDYNITNTEIENKSFELFAQGFNNVEVAEELNIAVPSAFYYHKKFKRVQKEQFTSQEDVNLETSEQ